MTHSHYRTALIVGAGSGLSAALARTLAKEGIEVALAARQAEKLAPLARETGARSFSCDAADRAQVDRLFADVEATMGAPEIVIYNAGYRARGPFRDIDPADVEKALAINALGAFLVAQQAVRRMLPKGRGAILFTGASASKKGYAQSAPFAMGKFALRGLVQSMARELGPLGIHVAHPIVDGAIDTEFIRSNFPDRYAQKDKGGILNPDHIAENYWMLHCQPRDAWTHELDLRPWTERW